jgi:hypothetical protein
MQRDDDLLASLDKKLAVVRSFIRGVAEGYHSGFYLWGEGGISKSFTVAETLDKFGRPFKLTNSRVTAKGLFTHLRDFPDAVHVMEDVETLFQDDHTVGVLRSALWGQGDRVVCWATALAKEQFVFDGGIILLANCDLADLPLLRALKTRIACVNYKPTNDELAALMRQLARDGQVEGAARLGPAKALEVVDAILQRCQRLQRNLDLRLLVNALKDRLQCEDGATECDWRDLLDARMSERVVLTGRGLRQQKKNNEREIAHQIVNLPPQERLTAWEQATGKSLSSLYRCLRQAT